MEQVTQQLKASGLDLAWWPVVLSSYQADYLEAPAIVKGASDSAFTQSLHSLSKVLDTAEIRDFDETLPEQRA